MVIFNKNLQKGLEHNLFVDKFISNAFLKGISPSLCRARSINLLDLRKASLLSGTEGPPTITKDSDVGFYKLFAKASDNLVFQA